MLKIIKGLTYDTNTANHVGDHENASLYLKRTGEFFLFEDEEVTPISYEDAETWVKTFLDSDVYGKLFGEIMVDEDAVEHFNLHVPKHLMITVRRQCAQEGISVRQGMLNALEAYYGDQGT